MFQFVIFSDHFIEIKLKIKRIGITRKSYAKIKKKILSSCYIKGAAMRT